MTETSSSPRRVKVALGERSYTIVIGPGQADRAGALIRAHADSSRLFVLSDETVAGLHLAALETGLGAAGLKAGVMTLPPGEASKSLTQLEAVLDWLLAARASRDDLLIAFGGGVIGDLAGLAASLMKRGMQFVQIPTTLLAQVDSSVGGKTAVNSDHGKNLIGSFYQPSLVIADTALLATLDGRQIRAGYAEILKYALIGDAGFFDWLNTHDREVLALDDAAISHAVATSCRAKAEIVAADEHEHGKRALLNFGHSFAHALEAANAYRDTLLHGEAVACGMALATRYSYRLGLIGSDELAATEQGIRSAGLAVRIADLAGGPYGAEQLAELMQQDKKARAGRLPLILTRGIGRAFIHDHTETADLRSFLDSETTTT